MAATKTDFQAIKQTKRNKNPARSAYIYMVWAEIAVNIAIAVLGWLFLDGILKPTVPVLFFILFCWVFEIQLLMQIIINRIAVIAESQSTVRLIKYGTVIIITLINISVFIIWIPSHLDPPVNDFFVLANKYYDPVSKVLILIVDAALNWYFVKSVKERLAFLIGLMFLPNPVVFIQFHPVTYLTKLNIEMSVANLIARLARGGNNSDQFHSSSYNNTGPRTQQQRNNPQFGNEQDLALKSFTKSRIRSEPADDDSDHGVAGNGGGITPMGGIHKRLEYEVTIHQNPSPGGGGSTKPSSSSHSDSFELTKDDEMALTKYAGHPRSPGM
ncbi:hypothetical protein PG997_005565 [Apiospora hydei]|uniref:Uncharacterized protein n=1 Tax=Apiospora hydei TaxID=1337664 RepID=A0ABR1WL80_9PEZI